MSNVSKQMEESKNLGNIDEDAGDEEREGPEEDPEESQTEGESQDNAGEDDSGGSPFSYSEARQSSIYPLPETWKTYEQQTRFNVMLALRQQGVMDLPKREIDDAMLQFASEHTEEIIKRVAEARGIELEG